MIFFFTWYQPSQDIMMDNEHLWAVVEIASSGSPSNLMHPLKCDYLQGHFCLSVSLSHTRWAWTTTHNPQQTKHYLFQVSSIN